MKKTGPKGSVQNFSVDYNAINTSDILDIGRYFMKETCYKITFGLIKKMFIGLFNVYSIGSFRESLVSNSIKPIKCVFLNNHPCQARPRLVNKSMIDFF